MAGCSESDVEMITDSIELSRREALGRATDAGWRPPEGWHTGKERDQLKNEHGLKIYGYIRENSYEMAWNLQPALHAI